jgi:hypothetical protein
MQRNGTLRQKDQKLDEKNYLATIIEEALNPNILNILHIDLYIFL